ncbi:MAG: DMT family transporter [Candidatus Thorarchaeota archaeon]
MLGEILAILAVLTFVISNVIFRKTESESTPLFINFFRTFIGTVTFIVLSIFLNIFNYIFLLPIEIWLLLFLSFVFGQVIGDTAYFIAQKELGTTIALAVSMTFPLFTFILSLLFLKRPFELRMLMSLILVSLGIIIIGKNKISTDIIQENISYDYFTQNKPLKSIRKRTSIKGIIAGLFASLGWAFGLIIIDFITNRINNLLNINEMSSIIGNTIRFPFALLILLALFIRENKVSKQKKRRSLKTYILLLVGSIIGSSIGAYLYTEAARTAGANVMSLIAAASPLFAIPLTYWVNKERLTKIGFIGVILTIIGVVILLL